MNSFTKMNSFISKIMSTRLPILDLSTNSHNQARQHLHLRSQLSYPMPTSSRHCGDCMSCLAELLIQDRRWRELVAQG